MKIVTLFFSLIISLGSNADVMKSDGRFLFEFPEKTGTIRKMQIDLTESNQKWLAQTRSLTKNGKVEPAQLPCIKINETEFKCRRSDGGGSFDLITSPTPKITISYFSADEEGDDVKTAIKAPKGETLVFSGKKVPISSKDSFATSAVE